ncbi:MAG: histidinol-phosphatase [Treponema sp.]|nr:histidinol-phosphatase [Treponema sp.]
MKYSSLHTHTCFCDGSDDIETMCRAAYAKGLVAVGFSAHAPIAKKTGFKLTWHLPDDRLYEYIDEVHAARRRWEGKINVYLGLEVDYIKGLRCAMDSDIRSLDLDYCIGSVHYIVPGNGSCRDCQPFTVDGSVAELEQGVREGFGGDNEALMHAYWDAVAEMIGIGGFDILGHADLIRMNNPDDCRFTTASTGWNSRLAEIAGAASRGGCVVEVNTGGLNRGKYADTYPSPSFLRLFRENNVPAVITADAHRAKDLDGHYEAARRNLLEAGYSEHVLLKGKVNGRAMWESERL